MKHIYRNTLGTRPNIVGLGALALAGMLGASLATAAPTTGTNALYTMEAEFNSGIYLNTHAITPGALVTGQVLFTSTTTTFPYLYVAASLRGTIVRIDVNTGAILGEYWTAPDKLDFTCYDFGKCRDPSRTTVDREGNVWVTNRAESGLSPALNGIPKGSITRVGLIIGGTRVNASGLSDPNGNYLMPPFQYNTCEDRDGDGLIKTSRGLGDIRPWNNAGGVDSHGGVSTAEDECIINYTRVTGTNTRTVAVDSNNDVWVGGANSAHEKLDGVTGQPIPGTQFNLGCGGYGGLIDKFGVLWSARYPILLILPRFGYQLLRFDTKTRIGQCLDFTHGNYGLGLDPKTCHIWHTMDVNPYFDPSQFDLSTFDPYNPDPNNPGSNGTVVELDKAGNILNNYGHGLPLAQGVVVDGNSNVWVAHSKYTDPNVPPITTVGHLKTDGTFVGNVPLVDINTSAQGSGPTGVAVDTNGKIWVTNFFTNNVMRIDLALNPTTNPNHSPPIGAVDLTVALGAGAEPYNYSDMTGGQAISNPTGGFWSRVHDGLAPGTRWGRITWNTEPEARVPSGIVVEARASDSQAALGGQIFIPVTSGVPFDLTGQYIEVRATMKSTASAGCVESPSPILADLRIQGSCYVDADADIDKLDLSAISRARGTAALPGDLRDADGDGMITPADVKFCLPKCTRANCATQ